MRSTKKTKPARDARNQTSKSRDAKRLFEELLACDPRPTIKDLVRLVGTKNLPNRTVFAAIVSHPDFDLERPGIELFAPKYILDSWGLLPMDRIDGKLCLDILDVILPHTENPKFDQIRLDLGRRLLELRQYFGSVFRYVPSLKQEAWDILIQQEGEDDAIELAIYSFAGEDRKQKIFWILEHRPNLADRFLISGDPDIANEATVVILSSTAPIETRTLCQIVDAADREFDFIRPNLATRAIDQLLFRAEQLSEEQLLLIIRVRSSSEMDKRHAADILLNRNPDCILPLQTIIDYVPSRVGLAQEALKRVKRAIAEEEAKRPRKDRLIEEILQL